MLSGTLRTWTACSILIWSSARAKMKSISTTALRESVAPRL